MVTSCLGRQEHGCGNVSAGRPPTAAAMATPHRQRTSREVATPAGDRDRSRRPSKAYSAPGVTGRTSAGSRRYRPITSTVTCSISILHHRRRSLPTLGEAGGFVEVQSQKLSMLSVNFSLPRGAGGLTPSQPPSSRVRTSLQISLPTKRSRALPLHTPTKDSRQFLAGTLQFTK